MIRYCNYCGMEYEPDRHQERMCSDNCRKAARTEAKRQSNERLGKVIRYETSYLNPEPGGTDYDRWLRRDLL